MLNIDPLAVETLYRKRSWSFSTSVFVNNVTFLLLLSYCTKWCEYSLKLLACYILLNVRELKAL